MGKAAGSILKSDDVELQGRLLLDAAQAGPGLSKRKTVASVTPQAHIVEKHPEFAVIEMTCSCGTKTYLRCEYANAEPSVDQKSDRTESSAEDNQTQNAAIAGSDQGPDQAE